MNPNTYPVLSGPMSRDLEPNKTVMTGHGFGHFQLKVISVVLLSLDRGRTLTCSFMWKNRFAVPISPKGTLGYPHEGPRVVCHFRNRSNRPVMLFQVEDTNLLFRWRTLSVLVEDTNLLDTGGGH